MPVVLLLFDGKFFSSGFLGRFVENEISGDGEEEGREFGRRLVAFG